MVRIPPRVRCERRLPSLDGTASDFLVPDAASSRAALRGARAANIGSKGQLHGAYEQEIGLECRKNDVASCSASVVQCRSATCSWYWFWRRRADARIPRPSTPMTTRHASGTDLPREQTDLSPARCACKDHAEEQLISHNGRAHPRAAAASARLLPHLAGRPARPAFESMRERADILVTEQPRNLGNRQAFVRQMALGEI